MLLLVARCHASLWVVVQLNQGAGMSFCAREC